jgi:hypothetical protein
MNFWDWFTVTMLVLTAVGIEVTPKDFNEPIQRTTAAQSTSEWPSSVAGLAIGGEDVMEFADSGVATAHERAMVARQNLQRAIAHYDLAHKYHPIGLRLSGGKDYTDIYYLDMRLVTVTAADAKAMRAASAHALAESWKKTLDAAFKDLPKPTPEGWVAVTGEIAGATMVSDELLARAAAAAIDYRPGQQVRVSAKAGMVVLDGTVATESQRRNVVNLAAQLPGARGVIDRLKISP